MQVVSSPFPLATSCLFWLRRVRQVPALLVVLGLLAGLGEVRAGELLNGDMAAPFVPIVDDPAGGSVPTGWSPLKPSNPPDAPIGYNGFERGQSTQNSPFTDVFADNESSFLISDSASGVNNYGMFQNFTEGYRTGLASFDFKMENLASGFYSLQYGNNGNFAGGSQMTLLRFMLNRNGYFGHQGAPTTVTDVLAVTAGVWYHVEFTFEVGAAFNGTITPFGASPVEFSGWVIGNAAPNFSGVVLRDRDNAASGDVYLDNVYLVPEPGVVGLLLGTGAGLWAFSARRKRTRN